MSPALEDRNRQDCPITFVRTAVQPPDPAERRMPYWMTRITHFDRIEVRPHILRADPQYSYLDPCGERDADFWVVMGCYEGGGIEHCEHFPTKEQARIFRRGLVSACPHLGRLSYETERG